MSPSMASHVRTAAVVGRVLHSSVVADTANLLLSKVVMVLLLLLHLHLLLVMVHRRLVDRKGPYPLLGQFNLKYNMQW